MILRCLWLLAALTPCVFADVEFTSPAAGASITGSTLDIKWKDSGVAPKISTLASYQIFLCAGGNSAADFIQLATLVTTGDFTTGDTTTATVSLTVGAAVDNAYFLKIISAATGGSVINYSDRFSLPGMTGVFPAAVTAGLQTVSGTAGPPTENDITTPQNGAGTDGTTVPAAGASEYNVPYTMQTAEVRYAPMPPMAVSSITAKNPSRQYQTSAYTVYATNAGTPNAITTQTASLTFSTTSIENTAAAAGQPTDAALQKFLNRWKD